MKIESKDITMIDVESIVPNPKNANRHSIEQIKRLEKLIKYQGFRNPLIVSNRTGFLVVGHGRLEAAKNLGMEKVPVIYQDFENEAQEYAYLISDNEIARWAELDKQALYEDLKEIELDDIEMLGIEDFKIIDPLSDNDDKVEGVNLSNKYGAPPFSVLDTRQGYWQDRKKSWLAMGIKSELGRSVNENTKIKDFDMEFKTGFKSVAPETSVFDPVLCEVVYRWFSKLGDNVIDCFSGGSVRGVVASNLERYYLGLDLREDQINANKDQLAIANENYSPIWKCADSLNIKDFAADYKADLLFSCPPYADLEVYSDDNRDLSNMSYVKFIETYGEIIKKCYEVLSDDRFACFVVGEVRSKKGSYYNFVSDTIKCFIEAGFGYYNEIILLNQAGTAAMRANKAMQASRKVIKTHQNVLVFVKGDPKKATARMGEIYIPKEDGGLDV